MLNFDDKRSETISLKIGYVHLNFVWAALAAGVLLSLPACAGMASSAQNKKNESSEVASRELRLREIGRELRVGLKESYNKLRSSAKLKTLNDTTEYLNQVIPHDINLDEAKKMLVDSGFSISDNNLKDGSASGIYGAYVIEQTFSTKAIAQIFIMKNHDNGTIEVSGSIKYSSL